MMRGGRGAIDYYKGVERLKATHGLSGTSWADVHSHVKADPTLCEVHQNNWGQPLLRGRTTVQGGGIESDPIKGTLDHDGLVLIGNRSHWKVMYGYQQLSDNSFKYKVYDPMSNKHATMDEASLRKETEMTIQVTA